MERDYIQFLMDMISSIKKIEKYTSEFGINSLNDEGIYYDAVLRNLEIIGEASKSIPDDVKITHPDVSWKEIYGLRNIISHAYFGIDVSEIEFIILNDVPELKSQLEEILKQLEK
jgi:uncharacterized protein with HEPN domain